MKKIYLAVFLACSIGGGMVNAQESVGGVPWSMSKRGSFEEQKVSVLSLPTPDYAKAKAEDEYNESIGKPGKYRVALAVNTNINLNNSGTFTYLSDGSIIWRLKVQVPNSQALKLNYGDFHLPAGITYFVQNENKKQIIGGYDFSSNTYTESMAHEMVQGESVNLEMDIQPGVNLNNVKFQINQVYGLYRGAERVIHDFGTPIPEAVYEIGASNACQINAKCAQGQPWFNYANAAAHIWITDGLSGGFCSGTLINNKNNDCTPLFITASHCDANNAYSNSNFSQWEFTFNLWSPLCSGGGTLNQSKVIKGADFQARSYNTIPPNQESGPLYGDFLLLKIKDPTNLLRNWGLAFAGWNRADASADTAWVSFHHPKGDIMKFTKMKPLDGTGDFNTGESGTHWAGKQVIGGSEPGSSGSGIWEASTGRLIGDLSGGSGSNPCATNRWNLYSKIYHNWVNSHDTTYYNDTITAVNSSLSSFLDPSNSGAMTADFKWFTNPCTTGIHETNELDNSLLLYPNPTSGNVYMKVNLSKIADMNIEVFNVVGQKAASYVLKNVGANQELRFDLSHLETGIYLMKISSGNTTVTRKILLKK
jgi:hypothetical protein